MDFDTSFGELIGNEGDLSMNPKDPGNWTGGMVGVGTLKGTKFGVSAASYPMEDIASLTLDQCKAIYKRDYWGAAGCDALPERIKFDLFDMAVNSGVRTAVKTLQGAVGETQDGLIGSHTLAACNTMNQWELVARFNAARLLFMSDLHDWPAFGRGWAKRIAHNILHA